MREKKTKARWKGILAFTGIFLVLFLIVSDIMSVSDCTSLANIRGFYMEPKNSLDVAMIGPSEFYADYSRNMDIHRIRLRSPGFLATCINPC